MKVLWISNIIFPELCDRLGMPAPVFAGWMQSGAKALLEREDALDLAVVSFYQGDSLQVFCDSHIRYYLVPEKTTNTLLYDARVEHFLKVVNDDFKPNLVHIHGTEYGHSLAQIRACGSENTVVSIQGLVHYCKDYYFGGISERELIKCRTFRDIVRRDSLFNQRNRMAKRGLFEVELLKSVRHVIGRTSWDKACVWALNPNANYHSCNETLRDGFYNKQWQYDKCSPHTIFLSQGHYPLKGLHQVIKSLPLILREYPDTEVYVSGYNFFSGLPFWRKNGYANFVQKLLMRLGVTEKVHFLGQLNEEQMIAEYMNAHVFVCPSAIENSPNSVGEAQLLGTPVVASYVGGTMDMVKDGETGFLYRYEEISLLAQRVCELFSNRELCERISVQERTVANSRHSKDTNATALVEIYKEIVR